MKIKKIKNPFYEYSNWIRLIRVVIVLQLLNTASSDFSSRRKDSLQKRFRRSSNEKPQRLNNFTLHYFLFVGSSFFFFLIEKISVFVEEHFIFSLFQCKKKLIKVDVKLFCTEKFNDIYHVIDSAGLLQSILYRVDEEIHGELSLEKVKAYRAFKS